MVSEMNINTKFQKSLRSTGNIQPTHLQIKLEEIKIFESIIKIIEKNLKKLSGNEDSHRVVLCHIKKLFICLKQLVIQIEDLENNSDMIKTQEKKEWKLINKLKKVKKDFNHPKIDQISLKSSLNHLTEIYFDYKRIMSQVISCSQVYKQVLNEMISSTSAHFGIDGIQLNN